MPFATASRIWFVSNLGNISQEGVVDRSDERDGAGASRLSCGGGRSSILIQLLHLDRYRPRVVHGRPRNRSPRLAIVVGLVLAAAIASLPFTLPRLASVTSALTGRNNRVPPLATNTLLLTVARSLFHGSLTEWRFSSSCAAYWVLLLAPPHRTSQFMRRLTSSDFSRCSRRAESSSGRALSLRGWCVWDSPGRLTRSLWRLRHAFG